MKEYNFFLNKFIKKKYKDSTIFKLSLIKNFVYHRDYFIKYINKKKILTLLRTMIPLMKIILKFLKINIQKTLINKL